MKCDLVSFKVYSVACVQVEKPSSAGDKKRQVEFNICDFFKHGLNDEFVSKFTPRYLNSNKNVAIFWLFLIINLKLSVSGHLPTGYLIALKSIRLWLKGVNPTGACGFY